VETEKGQKKRLDCGIYFMTFLLAVAIGSSLYLLVVTYSHGRISVSETEVVVAPDRTSEFCEAEVKVSNTGLGWLKIEDVHTTCGCLETKLTAEKIPPGGSAVLLLKILPHTSRDKIVGVAIASDDPNNSLQHINVVIHARQEVFAVPSIIGFGNTYAPSSRSAIVHANGGFSKDEEVTVAASDEVRGLAINMDGDRTKRLSVELSDDIAKGAFRVAIDIESSKRTEKCRIIVAGNILGSAVDGPRLFQASIDSLRENADQPTLDVLCIGNLRDLKDVRWELSKALSETVECNCDSSLQDGNVSCVLSLLANASEELVDEPLKGHVTFSFQFADGTMDEFRVPIDLF